LINQNRRVGIACYSAGSGFESLMAHCFRRSQYLRLIFKHSRMILSSDLTATLTSTRRSVKATSNPSRFMSPRESSAAETNVPPFEQFSLHDRARALASTRHHYGPALTA